MLVVGDVDVVVAVVVVRLVVVGREVVVFFVVVGVLELLGVAMTAASGCFCSVLGAMPAPTKNDSRANGITAFHWRCPGLVMNQPPHGWPEKRQPHEEAPGGTIDEHTEDEDAAKDDTDNSQDGFYDLRHHVDYHDDASIMMPNCGVDMSGATGPMGAITSCRCLSKCRAP